LGFSQIKQLAQAQKSVDAPTREWYDIAPVFLEHLILCKHMAKTMHLTAAYSYFYFYAFDPGG